MGELSGQDVSDGAVVLAAADQYAHRGCHVVSSELVIDQGHVEVEFAGVLGLEFAGLKLKDHVAPLFEVEEQQVGVIPSSE